jgi:hypothetical protein
MLFLSIKCKGRPDSNVSCFIMWLTTLEVDAGDIAVLVEPSRQ